MRVALNISCPAYWLYTVHIAVLPCILGMLCILGVCRAYWVWGGVLCILGVTWDIVPQLISTAGCRTIDLVRI